MNVGYAKDRLTLTDIIPSDTNATVELYPDSGFLQDKDADVLLAAGRDTPVYIKVIAAGGEYASYYKITITRPADPTLSASPVSLGSDGGTSTITVTGTDLADGMMLQIFDSANSAVTGQGTSATTTGDAASQSAVLTFPANASEESAVTYTVKASLDGGNTWIAPTVNVTVAAVTPAPGEQVITGLSDYNKTYGDESFTLTPSGYENPVFTFTSSNSEVAAVDLNTGKVTIVGAGTAEITVTAAATSQYTETSVKCLVTVNKAEQILSGLKDMVKIHGGQSFTITPGSNAASENPDMTYQSSDTSVIECDEGGVCHIKGVGTATITVLAGETANYRSASETFTIRVLADTASLEELIEAAEGLMNGLESEDIGSGNGQYPQEAVDLFQEAINKAKAIAGDTNATQEEIDQAKAYLQKAIEDFQNSLIQTESAYQFTKAFDIFTGSGSLTATINAPYDQFISLTVGGVQLDKSSYTVTEGSTIITLQEAYLKTLANGTYAVTAEFTGGSAATTLTVNASGTKSVTGVTLDQSSATVAVGNTLKLTATVSPSDAANKNVTWKSSDTSIATVDAEGKVTGVKTGTATITVTTEDGGHTAACKVTVTAASWSSANTGDNMNTWLWMVLLGATLLLMVDLYLIRKTRRTVRKRK